MKRIEAILEGMANYKIMKAFQKHLGNQEGKEVFMELPTRLRDDEETEAKDIEDVLLDNGIDKKQIAKIIKEIK